MYLPSIYERAVNITLNGESKGQYFEGDNNYMRNFGEFQEGEHITLILTLTKDNLYFREAQFAIMDKEKVQAALEELNALNTETVCYQGDSTTHVVTEVNCDADRTLFTTIPDEKGWTVYVDGQQTDYIVTVDSLIAVPLTAGYHKVEMRFTTAGYPAAVLLTLSGIIIFVGLILLWLKRNPRDRAERRARRLSIYTGEAYIDLKDRDEGDLLERRRPKSEKENEPEENTEEPMQSEGEGYFDYENEDGETEEIVIGTEQISGSGGYETELDEDDEAGYQDNVNEDMNRDIYRDDDGYRDDDRYGNYDRYRDDGRYRDDRYRDDGRYKDNDRYRNDDMYRDDGRYKGRGRRRDFTEDDEWKYRDRRY